MLCRVRCVCIRSHVYKDKGVVVVSGNMHIYVLAPVAFQMIIEQVFVIPALPQ